MSAHPRFSMNQATIKYADLDRAIESCLDAGVQSIGLWREPVAEIGLASAATRLRGSGLRFSSLCRGGFLTQHAGPDRTASIDDNRRAIEETATLAAAGAQGSAASLIMVAGGLPDGDRDLAGARDRFAEAIALLAPEAEAAGVTLVLEPLHPMYASDRAVLSTLKQGIDVAESIGSPNVGVVVDTFHVWWDPELFTQIARAGRLGRLTAYQVCDWRTPLPADVLLARHLTGDGIIDFTPITRAVLEAGYDGDIEVEVFNQEIWDRDPGEVTRETVESFGAVVGIDVPVPTH